jgi:hypothetical protein
MADCNHKDIACLDLCFALSITRANSDLNLSFAAWILSCICTSKDKIIPSHPYAPSHYDNDSHEEFQI